MRCRSSLLIAMLAGLGLGTAQAQTRIVTGRVTDSLTQAPVTSGQVAVQGTTVGTTIKDDGTFTIAAPARDVMLMVRSIGFKRKDLALPANQNSASVALERDYFQLEAIVVTGQATGVERKNLANAVASVTAEQLVKAPTASVEQSLQGKLAGANITQNTFAPGGGVLVRLRGVTSINGNFTPLYVVDGVIVSDAAIMPGNNFITQSTPGVNLAANTDGPVNRIADLNPSDIESVEVLKGASASAIYGSKASNGVIMITTKRGRIGAPQFRLTQRVGVSRMSHQIGVRRFNDAAEAAATFGPAGGADFTAAGGAFYDHEKEIAGGTPLSHETSMDVSGGTETSRYFASGLVKHDGGIVQGTYYDKQTVRLNLDQDVGRKLTFTIQAGATHSISDRGLVNNENNGSSYWSAFSITPSFWDLRATCPDGTRQAFCEGGLYAPNKYGSSNPLQTAASFENREHVWRLLGTGKINYSAISTPQHTLRILANGGVDYFNQRNSIFSPPDLQFEAIDGLLGTSAASISDNVNSNVNANMVYTFKSGGTSATTQVGVAYETRSLDVNRTLGANLVGGLRIPQAGTTIYVESRKEKTRDLGFFAQEEFLTLGEKLLLTVGARADQSSDNGDPDKIFFYPKASASYRWNVKKSVLDDLKFRAAFGQSGNQPIYGTKFSELAPVNIGGVPGSRLATITASDSLKPERQREIEAGIDATLFKGRASLEATVYQKEISELILRRGLATSTGFTTQIFNGGSLRNRGLELTLNLVPVQSRSFQWNARTNFAMNRCKITALPVPTFRSGGVTFGAIETKVGESCTAVVGPDTLGRLPGDAALGTIGDVVVRKLRDQEPDFNLGFSNDITFKALRLYFLWDYQQGGALANLTNILYDFPGNSPDQKIARNPNSKGVAATTGDFRANNFFREGLLIVESQTYVKLREVSLSLELPAATVHRFWSGARFVRFTVTGRNLLSFFPYIGMDPEATQIPASLARGRAIDIWPYPPSRSVFFAIDLGF